MGDPDQASPNMVICGHCTIMSKVNKYYVSLNLPFQFDLRGPCDGLEKVSIFKYAYVPSFITVR